MEKTSKVIQVAGNGHYDSQYGRMYRFEISFENGDSGQYSSKSENQTKFILQQEATYTMESKDYNGRTYYTIKPAMQPAPAFGGGGAKFQKDPETEKRITRMSVLKVAGDLAIHGEIKIHDITKVAQILERYVLTGEDSISSIYAKAEPKNTKGNIEQNFLDASIDAIESDDLPF